MPLMFSNKSNAKLSFKIGVFGCLGVGLNSLICRYIHNKFDDMSDIRDARCILFVFDLAAKPTLYPIKKMYKDARRENRTFIPILIGTKYDVFSQMNEKYKLSVTRSARRFAYKMSAALIFCSALTKINVDNIFEMMLCKLLRQNINIAQKHNELNDAIIEWKRYNETELTYIVYGYIRRTEIEYEWEDIIPVNDVSNIILLFYASIVIGGTNKEYKSEYQKLWKNKKVKAKKRKKKKKERSASLQHDQI